VNHRSAPSAFSASAPHLALLGVQILFGTWPIVGKVALRSLSSTELVALRTSGAAVAFLILQSVSRNDTKIARHDYLRLAVYSLLGVVANQLLFVKGLSLTTAINTTLLGTTIPIFALVVSIFFGFDRPSFKRLTGISLAGCGVLYLLWPERHFTSDTALGNMLIVANSLCYGAYIALSTDVVKRYGALRTITWLFVFGSLVTAPLGVRAFVVSQEMPFSTPLALAVLYIIMLPTVGAYYLNAWALGRVPPSTVAVYVYLQPLFAFAIAPLILGEQLSMRTVFSAVLIMAGIAIVSIPGRSHAVREVSEHPEALSH
jgi:drug/metabolite transporter (DMT)-like permease